MSTDERARRAETRDIVQLEAAVAELQQTFSDQLVALSDTILDHSCTLDQIAGNMTTENSHYRGANVPLSPFRGNRDEDFAQYIKHFELICQANNYAEDKRAQILAPYLLDKAFYVYDSLTSAQKADYDQLKAALCEKFQTTDYRRYDHQKFQSRNQLRTESISDYGCAIHKLGMAAMANVDADQRDALIREKFISGLLPDLHELIVYSNPKNFHEAMTLAERLEGLHANKTDHSARNVMLLESIHDRLANLEVDHGGSKSDRIAPEFAYVVNQQGRYPEAISVPQPQQSNLNNFRQTYRPSGVVCFQCNRTGHIARNCGRNQNMNTIVCRNCNAMGHFARDCQRRVTMNRGRGQPTQRNNWRSYAAPNPEPHMAYNGPPRQSMAIDAFETEENEPTNDIQPWKPLIGAIKVSNKGTTD